MKATALSVLGCAVLAFPVFSQAPPAARPQFDVVSIKVQPPPLTRIIVTAPPGRFIAEGFSLKMLAGRAYGLPEARVLGGPGWADSERYFVEAKAEGTIPPGQLNLMLQSMLEDRFQLKAHKETRELPAYELVVARGGPKLKLSEDQTPPPAPAGPPPGPPGVQRGAGPPPGPPGGPTGPGGRGGPFGGGPPPRGMFTAGFGNLQATATQIGALVNFLAKQLGRQVTDKTGLTALYDIKLEWTPGSEQAPSPFGPNPNAPPPPADPSGPSLFTALQEQLGLRLESTKGDVEVLVIDSAQKPAEN